MTSNLPKRVYEHKEHLVEGFTKRYNVDKLVYYEVGPIAEGAISREKQLKACSHMKKIVLIEKLNSDWQGLCTSII